MVSIVNRLAAGFSSNKSATVWKIKLRNGVQFHDGSALTAHDVVFSLRCITSPKNKLQGAGDLPFLKPSAVRKLDASTVETAPDAADRRPANAARSARHPDHQERHDVVRQAERHRPVSSSSPSSAASAACSPRSRAYRVHKGPKLDELTLISIDDSGASANALVGGQVDAIANLDAKLVPTVTGNSKLRVLQSKTGGHTRRRRCS